MERSLLLVLACAAVLPLTTPGQSLPATVKSLYPAPGATGVARNTVILLRMERGSDQSCSTLSLGPTGGTARYVSAIYGDSGTDFYEMVFIPESPLAPSTNYTAVCPSAGWKFSFTTGADVELDGPRLLSVSPDPASRDTSPLGPFFLHFDKPLLWSRMNISVAGGSGQPGAQLTADRKGIEIRPQFSGLIPTVVTIQYDPSTVRDLKNNPGSGTSTSVRFLTSLSKDANGPQLLASYPETGASSVPTNAVIQLLFDRPVAYQTPQTEAIVLEARGASVPVQFTNHDSLVTLDGVTLLPNTPYRVRITTRLLDSSGVPASMETSLDFTTSASPELATNNSYFGGPRGQPAPTNTQLVIRSARRLPAFVPEMVARFSDCLSGQVCSPLSYTAKLQEEGRVLVITPRQPLPAWANMDIRLPVIYDITGGRVEGAWSFTTTDQIDTEPPILEASYPADGDADVSTRAAYRFVLNEAVATSTPANAVRLTRDGQPVEATMSLSSTYPPTEASARWIEFGPRTALDPNANYEIELLGVADLAGNVMPARKIRFKTAADSTVPAPPQLVSNSLDLGQVGARQPLTFEFSQPLLAGKTTATVSVVVPRENSTSLTFPVRVSTEVSGSTLRLVPLLAWPAARDLTLNFNAEDRWGRAIYYSTRFQATAGGDTDRPQVVSIDPPAGTALAAGQAIRVRFSKAMLSASQVDGGLTLSLAGRDTRPQVYWSDDQTTAFLVPSTGYQYSTQAPSLTLVVSSAMADLSGNPARAFTAVYPSLLQGPATGVISITKFWPGAAAGYGYIDVRSNVTLYLSAPVDANRLNRSVWFVTPLGRVAGTWTVTADGRFATFQPDQPWPAASNVALAQTEQVLTLYSFSFNTPAVPSPALSVLRNSLYEPHPANAVIDVEFNQDLPAGPGPVRLQSGAYYGATSDLPFDESRPRPNVLRLTPRTAPTVGSYLYINPKPGSTLTAFNQGAKVVAAINPPPAEALFRSPLPDSSGVARNARVSLVLSTAPNLVSLQESQLTLASGGASLPAKLIPAGYGARLTLEPVNMLPANSRIDVTLAGLEDRLGRAIPTISWSFNTGDFIDVTPPNLLYSNLSSLLDPLAPVVYTFDKPLDPAFSDGFFQNTSGAQWRLSPDLRSLSLVLDKGWNRGEAVYVRSTVTDWSGNVGSADSTSARAGFDADRTPPVLRAVSIVNGQTGLPLNTTLSLLFNKPLGSEAMRSVRLTSNQGSVPLVVKAPVSGNRVTLVPQDLLSPLTRYELIVEGVQDGSGNLMAERTAISFETGEAFNEATIEAKYRFVSESAPITVQFSRPIDTTPLVDARQLLTTYDPQAGSGYATPIAVSLTWSEDRTLLTLTPRQPLQAGIEHKLALSGVTGAGGGLLAPDGFTFTPGTVIDLTPARVRFSPADGSSAVPLNVSLQVSMTVAPAKPPAIRLWEGGKLVHAPVSWQYQGYNTANIATLQRTLKPNQTYRIEVDAFRDSHDNDIAAASASFTTGSTSEAASLRLVSSSPANGEAGVSPDAPWVLTFNMPLLPTSGQGGYIYTSRSIPFTTTSRADGPRFTITAAPSWPAASSVSLQWNSAFGPVSWLGSPQYNATPIGFRTAAVNDPTPPVLESVEPPSGATIPSGSAKVTLRFSKPVMVPESGVQCFYGADKQTVYGVVGKDFRSVTYALRPPVNSRVTIVGTADIRDNAENPITPFVIEYDTGAPQPAGPPSAKRTEPAEYGAAPVNSKITITFDRPMAPDTVLSAIRVTQNGQNVAGAIEVLDGDRSYRFTPAAPFIPGIQVKVFIQDTAQDTNGVYVVTGYSWPSTFYVEGTPPTTEILLLTRRGFLTTAPVDSTLEFELNQELDPASVDGESVWLRQGSRLVPGQVSLRDRAIVQFRPQQPLEAGLDYVLTAGSALRDLDGRQFRGQDLTFRATPAQPAADLESATEVDLDGRRAVRVRFTRPLSPLAIHGINLDRDGAPLEADVLPTTDPREFLLIPRDSNTGGPLHILLNRVPEASGRLLPFRRMATERQRPPR